MTHWTVGTKQDETQLENSSRKPSSAVAESGVRGLLFHEPWWLTAATGGNWRETTVTVDGRVVARLPYVTAKRYGLTRIYMPSFTNILGPVVGAGAGKPQTQLMRRMSLIRDLLDSFPPFDHFAVVLDPEGVDGLAFQTRGFRLSARYFCTIDCRRDLDELWKGMNYRLRQNIRRAEEKFQVAEVTDPEAFIDFYEQCYRSQGLRNTMDFSHFRALFEEASRRDAGEILCARWSDGRPAAMIFTAWDDHAAYYVLSARAGHDGDNGSICLLIWSALGRAHRRGLIFNFLGMTTAGRVKFYLGFGGVPLTGVLATAASRRYQAVAWIRQFFDSQNFR